MMADCKEDGVVLETTIVGMTDSGILRKRSVKRRISRDDTHQPKDRKYGNDKDDYRRIVERVLGERAAANAIEVLQERWRMIEFMYEDCMELVRQWDEQRLEKKHQRQTRRLLLLSVASLPLVFVFLLCMLATWFW